MRNRPLFLQLLYFVLPIYIIGWGVQYYFIGPFIEQFYLNETKEHLTSKAHLIQSGIDTKRENVSLQDFVKKSSKLSEIRITILDTNGVVLADSEEDPGSMENHRGVNKREEIEVAIKKGIGSSQRYSTTINEHMLYVAILASVEGSHFIIRTSESMLSLNTSINKVRQRIVLITIIILIVIIPAVIITSRFITRPLFLIGKAAKKISKGDMFDPIPISQKSFFSGTEEISSITVALNEMAKELDKKIATITREKNEQKNILNYINIIQYSMSEGLIAIDLENKFSTINKAASSYLNIDRKKDIGKPYDKKIKNKAIKKIIKSILKKQRPITKEIRIGRMKKMFFIVNGKVLKDQKSKPVGCLIVMTDVTRLKQLEAMRRVFVANVSHELKTPITSIGGYIETAQGDIPLETKNEFLEKAIKQNNRLNSIIDDLLRLSRIEAIEDEDTFTLSTQKLLPIIESSIEDIRGEIKKYGNKVVIECSDDICAKIDSQLMREALINLLENAIKYGFDNSTVILSVKRKSNKILIDIENKGELIPEKERDRIFNRFYRLDKSRSKKTGGTGLGLAIVKHISIVHNGTIEVHKSDGDTTVFRLTLPVRKSG
ncbi:ATP-binding protein [bacterium]|nr:ATP-binding protein [bacterium]